MKIDNYLKATDTSKDSDGYKNLDKELMDTLILLHMYFADNQELLEKRIGKFVENLNK
jgi:hypothetical protein